MRKKLPVRLFAGVIVFVAAATGLAVVCGGALTARAAGSPQPVAAPNSSAILAPARAATDTVSADPENDLTTATIDLHAGYILDPYVLPVVGKADIAASRLVTGCNGYLSADPSVVVNWSGKTDQLNFFVYSDDDTVLAIQEPDGATVCNDDAGRSTVDSLLTVKNPAAGPYKIYVGAAKKGQPALGFLGVTQSELDDARLAALDLTPMLRRRDRPTVQALPQLNAETLLTGRSGIFGTAELKTGFPPVQTFAAGGGDIAAIKTESQRIMCAGYISLVPSYSFTWTGTPQAIRIFFEALKDSSLAVVTPDQKILCGLNAGIDNLNPVIGIPSPAPGQYEVYVASMQPGTLVGGRLTISGDSNAAPAVLAPAGQ
jgi:hypothetical protein